MMIDLIRDMRKQWLRKQGMRYAQEVLREWDQGDQSDEQMRHRISIGPLSRRNSLDDPFTSGYIVQWQEIGAHDAQIGRLRAKKFRSHWYNMGWWNLLIERRNLGWYHRSLEKDFAEMGRLYWDRISVGRSDDYYST